MAKKVISILLVVALVMALSLALIGCGTGGDDISRLTVGNSKDLTVGIISDTQLSESKDSYYYNYIAALNTLKSKNVDSILFAGDMSDLNTKKSANLAKSAWVEVFGDIASGPIKNYIMGNHDFWLADFFKSGEIPSYGSMTSRFKTATGEEELTHKVLNGYHFINVSPANGDMEKGYNKRLKWIEKHIKLALEDGGDEKPIFINTHIAASETVYGSSDGGSSALRELYNRYPQVVSISGHSHSPALDEMSIWQGEFTAIQTQSLSYTYVGEPDIENQHTPSNQPVGMIMTLKDGLISIDRISARTGEKLKQTWSMTLPIKDNLTKYAPALRKAAAGKPTFSGSSIITTTFSGKYYVSIGAARAGTGANIRYYKLRLLDNTNYAPLEWFVNDKKTDYLTFLADCDQFPMSNGVVLELNRPIPHGEYRIEITAVDCYGNESEAITSYLDVKKK